MEHNLEDAQQPTSAVHPFEAENSSTAHWRRIVAPWDSVRVLTVYIGDVAGALKGNVSKRCLMASEVLFVVLSAGQIIVTLVLTALGITRKSPESGPEGLNEFGACPQLAIANMLWLGRTALGSYLLGWAHVMSRRWRKLRVANVNRPLASTGPEVDARLPCSRLAINLHMKLTLVFFLSTWVCLAISQVTWWTRYTRCRVDAPHIFALATILLVVANLSWLVYFLVQLTLSIKQMIQWFRANQPAIGKLSQSTVDRIPLIVYHHGGRDCNAFARPELHSACISPERNTASIRASIQSSLVAFVRSFYGSSGQTPVLLQADDEEGTEETPLVSWANSSQDTASIPDVNIPQDARCTICLCAFAPPASTDGPSDPSQRSTSSASPLLRLLSCGHVYHKECIDPWLTQRSGRCPYCQKPVDVSQPSSVQRRFWARLWR